jgi:hypothetical protein
MSANVMAFLDVRSRVAQWGKKMDKNERGVNLNAL